MQKIYQDHFRSLFLAKLCLIVIVKYLKRIIMKVFFKMINLLRLSVAALLLMTFSLTGYAQHKQAGQGAEERSSHSEQSQDYRRNFEKPSGYDTPKGGLMTQPWVWTLTAAVLVLIIGYIYKSNTDKDFKSESGVRGKTL